MRNLGHCYIIQHYHDTDPAANIADVCVAQPAHWPFTAIPLCFSSGKRFYFQTVLVPFLDFFAPAPTCVCPCHQLLVCLLKTLWIKASSKRLYCRETHFVKDNDITIITTELVEACQQIYTHK